MPGYISACIHVWTDHYARLLFAWTRTAANHTGSLSLTGPRTPACRAFCRSHARGFGFGHQLSGTPRLFALPHALSHTASHIFFRSGLHTFSGSRGFASRLRLPFAFTRSAFSCTAEPALLFASATLHSRVRDCLVFATDLTDLTLRCHRMPHGHTHGLTHAPPALWFTARGSTSYTPVGHLRTRVHGCTSWTWTSLRGTLRTHARTHCTHRPTAPRTILPRHCARTPLLHCAAFSAFTALCRSHRPVLAHFIWICSHWARDTPAFVHHTIPFTVYTRSLRLPDVTSLVWTSGPRSLHWILHGRFFSRLISGRHTASGHPHFAGPRFLLDSGTYQLVFLADFLVVSACTFRHTPPGHCWDCYYAFPLPITTGCSLIPLEPGHMFDSRSHWITFSSSGHPFFLSIRCKLVLFTS